MSTVLTAQGISEEYAEEIWFRDVLGRLWPAFEAQLKAAMAAAGVKVGVKGKVSRDTCSKKQWKKILSLLTAFTTTWVSRKTQKSDVVRSKYVAAVDAKAEPDADPSNAQCFWSEHPLPDPALGSKAEWKKLAEDEKQKVLFLQGMSAALLMRYSKCYLQSKLV